MKRIARLRIILLLVALGLPGCGGRPQWQICVENKGASPCSVYVTMGHISAGVKGTSEVHVNDVKPGGSVVLVVGEVEQTIRHVKVVRGGEEELLEVNSPLRPGQRCRIVISETRNVKALIQ